MATKTSTKQVAGVLPVFQTPFHPDETIDYETLVRELDWLLEAGSDGVVVAMVSEVLRLTETERRVMAEHVCRHMGDRGVVVVSVGAESAFVAEELSRHAESVGAHALMAIPPVSIAVGEDQIRQYYHRLAGATALPIIVQDASGYVGRPMSIDLQAGLLADLGDRIWFKPEANPIGPRLSELRDATRRRARVFEGTGGIALVDSHRRGIVGTMPGADLIHAIVPLWAALEAKDMARVNQLAPLLATLITLQSSLDAFLAIQKHLLVRQGVFQNTIVRGPVGYQLDPETRSEVDRLFDLLMDAVAAGS